MESPTRHEIKNAILAADGDVEAATKMLEDVFAEAKGGIPTLKERAARELAKRVGVGKDVRTSFLSSLSSKMSVETFLFQLKLPDFIKYMEDQVESARILRSESFFDGLIRGYLRARGYDKFPIVFPDPRDENLFSKLKDSAAFIDNINWGKTQYDVPSVGNIPFHYRGIQRLDEVNIRKHNGEWETNIDMWETSVMELAAVARERMRVDNFVPNENIDRSFLILSVYPADLDYPVILDPSKPTSDLRDILPYVSVIDSSMWHLSLLENLQNFADYLSFDKIHAFKFNFRDLVTRMMPEVTGPGDGTYETYESVEEVLDTLRTGMFSDRILDRYGVRFYLEDEDDVKLMDQVNFPLFRSRLKNEAVVTAKHILRSRSTFQHQWETNQDNYIRDLMKYYNLSGSVEDYRDQKELFLDTIVPFIVNEAYDVHGEPWRVLQKQLASGDWPDDSYYNGVRMLTPDTAADHGFDPSRLLPFYQAEAEVEAALLDTFDSTDRFTFE